MVTIELKVEGPDAESAKAFIEGMRAAFDERPGWRLLEHFTATDPDHRACPECGSPMVWEPALQAHVCHHPED